jgi:hypothetical protein
MRNNEGWLTNLSPGVVSQSKITLANHLHHKEKRRLFKTLAYILRIGAYRRAYGIGMLLKYCVMPNRPDFEKGSIKMLPKQKNDCFWYTGI